MSSGIHPNFALSFAHTSNKLGDQVSWAVQSDVETGTAINEITQLKTSRTHSKYLGAISYISKELTSISV